MRNKKSINNYPIHDIFVSLSAKQTIMSRINLEEFRQSVYDIVAAIPSGRVMTYGQIALLAGYPDYARQVGHVLHGSGHLNLPCHRVVNAQGRPAPGWLEQRKFLEAEGVQFKSNECVDMKKYQWKFEEEIKMDI